MNKNSLEHAERRLDLVDRQLKIMMDHYEMMMAINIKQQEMINLLLENSTILTYKMIEVENAVQKIQ